VAIKKMEIESPFEQSYWVEPGLFLAGAYPGSSDPSKMSSKLKALVEFRVDLVINLMEATEQDADGRPYVSYMGELKNMARQHGYDLEILRFPVRHLHVPSRHSLKNILDTIDQAMARGGRVYVHSANGLGRSGTVVGCYLLRRGLVTPDSVLNLIRELRASANGLNGQVLETPKQEHLVLTWKEDL
jgi:hypothetical protein